MAAYSIATAALALGVDRKRLENILSRQDVPGTRRGRQGQARRLSREATVNLAAMIQLEDIFSIPAPAAADLIRTARELSRSPSGSVQILRGSVGLIIDFAALESTLLAQLSEALEMAPRPRRGRPPSELLHRAKVAAVRAG
jgi:hypothetical protein